MQSITSLAARSSSAPSSPARRRHRRYTTVISNVRHQQQYCNHRQSVLAFSGSRCVQVAKIQGGTEQSMWAERERSEKRCGAGQKPTWVERSGERGSKNQVEREQEVVGTRRDRAVSRNPVNGAEWWAGDFAAPLTCSGLHKSNRKK